MNHGHRHAVFRHAGSLGTGSGGRVLQIAEAVLRHVGTGTIDYLPLRAGETAGAVVKADLTTQHDLYPKGKRLVTLDEGIGRTVAYYRALFEKTATV